MLRQVEVQLKSKLLKVELIKILKANPAIHRVTSLKLEEEDEYLVTFACKTKHLSEALSGIEDLGIGEENGTIHILSLEATIPNMARAKPSNYKRKYRLADRRTIREIEASIDGNLHLTFDYILMVVTASMIACVGLLSDSAVVVVASMLVSPLMGPIVAIAFGLATGRTDFIFLGLRNEMYGALIAITIGLISGSIAVLFYQPLGYSSLSSLTGNAPLYSEEMESRGRLISLFTGFWLAVPSGAGVALATVNASMSALVGVAISAALLPPLVNCAMNSAIGLIYLGAAMNPIAQHHIQVGGISFSLFVINFITIILTALITFRVKGISEQQVEFSLSKKIHHIKDRLKIGTHRRAEEDSVQDFYPPIEV